MGRAPCCDKANVKKGPWSPEEDAKLKEYIEKHGTGGNWIALPQKAGLKRCGKSCRLRWLNYLRPNIKHGEFSEDEDRIICTFFASIGSRWSIIASQLPGRTDNDIKNYWNTKLRRKFMAMNPSSAQRKLLHQVTLLPILENSTPSSSTSSSSQLSFRGSSNNSFYHPHVSFTGSESISYTSSLLSGNNSSTSGNSIFQAQDNSFMVPIQNYHVKDINIMFGGDQASCSSSDGSCNNQMVKEAEFGYGGDHGLNLSYLYNGGVEVDTQKFMLSNAGSVSGWTEKQKSGLLWEENENPLDYGIEEIKQLISTGSCNNFLFDENKTTEERVRYY